MILYSTDDDRLAFELGQDAAEVTVQFIPERFVTEERSPIFRREDRVHQDFGERFDTTESCPTNVLNQPISGLIHRGKGDPG